MIEYKLGLRSPTRNHTRTASITSVKRLPPSGFMEKKVCSDDEGIPFTTLVSYKADDD